MGFINLRETPINKSLLIFGDNRSGKTHLLASARELPELNPMLIDADRGVATWLKFPGIEDIIKIWRFAPVDKLGQLNVILDEVKKNRVGLLLFDSLSFFLHEAMIDLVPRGKVEIAHWNKLFQDTSCFISQLAKYCPNFVFTCFAEAIVEKTKDDLEGKTVGMEPMVYGRKFPKYMMNHFNAIGYLSTKSIVQVNQVFYESVLNTRMDGYYTIGDRLNTVDIVKQPTLKKIFDKMETGLKGAVK